ncbi:MAG: class I SAM-dependent methyltransferase [candidate division WOR-3 bacterium]|nr:MAG: class I SAM-dependent methyltransferase [candidate division WOR-3 bacterium]
MKQGRSHKNPLFYEDYYYRVRYACSFKRLAKQKVSNEMCVLEAGCGKRSVLKECELTPARTVGIEILFEDIVQNQALDLRTVGNLEDLPFRDEEFDLIICRNVVEHLPSPRLVFDEFARVLKEGGMVMIRTPNIYNPLMFISAVLPLRLRCWIKRNLLHDEEGDTFPTYYGCNSRRTMTSTLRKAGFTPEEVRFDGLMAYFDFSTVLLTLIVLYEKLTDFGPLRMFKMWLIAGFRKSSR